MTVEAWLTPDAPAVFPEVARRAVYAAIALRRDVRHFRAGVEVDQAVLERILAAAHRAPSVGLSQPWRFILMRDLARRERILASFRRCRALEAASFPPARREAYLSLKLEGIVEAPLNVCVVADLRPRRETVLGTVVQPDSLRGSVYCAVENFWLAARVEGIGVGWVSIVEPAVLRAELALPAGVEPVAYLCVGHPVAFRQKPMLTEAGWAGGLSLDDVVRTETWSEATTR